MMNKDKLLSENIAAVSLFERLQDGGKEPVLGVYRGRSLIVISYKTDHALEKVCLAIKSLVFNILEKLGLLTKSTYMAQSLKDKAFVYYYKQVEKHKIAELNKLESAHQKARQVFAQEISQLIDQRDTLIHEKSLLSADLNYLLCSKEQVQINFNTISQEYAVAKTVLNQKEETAKNISELNKQKNRLESEIRELETAKQKLIPTKNELERVKAELSQVKSDLSQNDFKSQVKALKSKVEDLETQIYRLEGDLRRAKDETRDAEAQAAYWYAIGMSSGR